MIFVVVMCFCLLYTNTESQPINEDEEATRNDYIPYIIGLCLSGFVIIVLVAAIIVCFCVRHKNQKQLYNHSEIGMKDVKIARSNEGFDPYDGDFTEPKLYIRESKRIRDQPQNGPTILDFRRISHCRRASVPATLSSVEEAPTHLEEGDKRISLSYNCLAEPLDITARKSVTANPRDKLYMPESGLSTGGNITRQSSVELKREFMHRKYSIYDDESLLADDYYSRFGKIFFSVQYNCDSRVLAVTLLKAQHLTGNRIKGKNRFYVKLRMQKSAFHQSISATSLSGMSDKPTVKPEKFNVKGGFRSSIQGDFCNPNFDETFKFSNVTPAILTDYTLQFVIKEETPKFLDKNRVIGYVDFILKNAELMKKHESISDIFRDVLPTGPVPNKGQAVLSLHYNRELSIISTSVLEIIVGSEELSGISVEMYTRSIDNIIQKKKTVLENNLRSTDVVEFPMENCFLNSVCLVVVIFARIRNCSKSLYGRFVVGPIRFTDGPGLTHWAEMTLGNQLCIKNHSII